MKAVKKYYLIFDGRYLNNPSQSTLYEVCETLEEAKNNRDDYGDNNTIVECQLINKQISYPKIVSI